MKRPGRCLWAGFLLALITLSASGMEQKERSAAVRRLSLTVGVNWGGPNRARLRYAVSDARAILQVFEELGGVDEDDSRLLVEPDRETLLWELRRLGQRIMRLKTAGEKVEMVIYFSGHADRHGILLGSEKLSFQEFREAITALRTDVCIMILDACASGAFIRSKGTRKAPAFLFDQSLAMKGQAVITSSSEDEYSQESDQIRGSFFTHYLLSALRGAADSDQDGRITLSEAYRYAFQETLSNTSLTLGQPQHPNYNIEMSGTGEMVLTDVRKSDCRLRFSEEISGTLFIQKKGGDLLTEVHKAAGRILEIGVAGGEWRILHLDGKEVREACITTPSRGLVMLEPTQFVSVSRENARKRGDWSLGIDALDSNKNPFRLFAALGFKMSLFDNQASLLPGIQLGVHNSLWALSLCGYNRSNKSLTGHPPYWGIAAEHLLFNAGRLVFSTGVQVGLGYREMPGIEEQPRELGTFWLVEPCVGLSIPLNPLICLSTRVAIALPIGKFRASPNYSWYMDIRLGGK